MRARLLSLSLLLPMFAHAGGEIIVREHSLILHGSPVVLGDVMDTHGLGAELSANLAKVPLAAAPDAGEKIEFSSAAVSSILRAALNKSSAQPHLRIPTHVVVERSTHRWEKSVIEKELLSLWQPICGNCQLELEQLNVPLGEFESWKLNPRKELPRGGFSVAAEVIKQGQSYTLWIQGTLIVRRNVPVAKRAIYFGERVRASDVEWAWRDVTLAQDGVPLSEDLVGRLVKAPMRAGDILFDGTLEREKALHRGDVARVVSGEGDWQVSITAVAQADADVGDTVTLKNPRNNKDLTGVVIAKDEVEIK